MPHPSLLDTSDPRPVHFVGIAGAGMSGLAELFVRRGVRVTGCDANITGTADLERLGISIVQGHDPSHVEGARALVITSAMPKDHPELERARILELPVVRRAEALGEAVSGGELVAIAGTHGKTTTTEMTTLALSPTIAVVTNVEADHLDIYKDLEDIRATFAQFVRGARTIVLCADDAGANTLPTPSDTEVIRYGLVSRDARLRAVDVRTEAGGSLFEVLYDGEELGEVELGVPGRHNVLNALAAIASGLALGASVDAMGAALSEFTGVERRFQRLGSARGVMVIDDYAHHPTEIRATLAAARAAFPGHRVLAAFQPHLYSRTRDFAGEFGQALAAADAVFLTEIYPAREKPIEGVTSDLIEHALEGAGGTLAWRGDRPSLAEALAGAVHKGDVVLTIGAGDITKTGPELLARLES